MALDFVCPHGTNVVACGCRKRAGIYRIISGKGSIYIGSARLLGSRMQRHYVNLSNNCHHSAYMQSSFNKHGKDHFRFEILEFVDDETLLLSREQAWLDDMFASGCKTFNSCRIAGSPIGIKHSAETRLMASLRRRGVPLPASTHQKALLANVGRKKSDSERQKLSDALRGRLLDPKAREAAISPETRMKAILTRTKGRAYRIISPEGHEYCDVVNIMEFSKEHGLNRGSFAKSLWSGKSHKGWLGFIQDASK